MPTGYTAGILDGTITTFEQYAQLCTRAFGAALHMRDEPLSAPFELAKPAGFYYDNVKKAAAAHEVAQILSNKELLKNEITRIKESIKSAKKHIEKQASDKANLTQLLNEAKAWQPPSDDYLEFKRFIEDQLIKTIEFDTSGDFWERRLAAFEKELSELTADKARAQLLEEAEKDLTHAKKSLQEEIERCDNRNKWIETLWQSLKPTPD